MAAGRTAASGGTASGITAASVGMAAGITAAGSTAAGGGTASGSKGAGNTAAAGSTGSAGAAWRAPSYHTEDVDEGVLNELPLEIQQEVCEINKIIDASAYFLYQGWFEICCLPTPFQCTSLLHALHSKRCERTYLINVLVHTLPY
jgi:hypothetical protein